MKIYYWAAQLRSLKQWTADYPCAWWSIEAIHVISYYRKYILYFGSKVLKKADNANAISFVFGKIYINSCGGKKTISPGTPICNIPTLPPVFNDNTLSPGSKWH
jgi:hypothetical protein